jgi:uncharacterized alkaline shock family protein YloU
MEIKQTSGENTQEAAIHARILYATQDVPGVVEITRCTITDAAGASASDMREYNIELGLSVEYKSSIPEIHHAIMQRLSEDKGVATGLRISRLSLCIEDICRLPSRLPE